MLNPYTSQEVTKKLADIYHSAALNGADMRRVTEALESLRQIMLGEKNPLDIWEALNARIGQAELEKFGPLLVELRNDFVNRLIAGEIARLRNAFDRSPEEGWAEWLEALVATIAKWVLKFSMAICEEPLPFPEAERELVTLARRSIKLALEQRFETLYDLILELLRRKAGDAAQQARLISYCAQIDLYIFQRPEDARKMLEKVNGEAENEDRVRCGWGEYYLEKGDLKLAGDSIGRAIELWPQRSEGYIFMGDLKQRQNDLIGAEEWYEKAVAMRPWSSTAHLRLMRAISRPGSFELREERVNRLIQYARRIDNDDDYGIFVDVGNAHRDHERAKLAHEWYQRAVELSPAWTAAYIGLGHLYLTEKSKDLVQARQFFQQAINVSPDDFEGYWGMGRSWEAEENWSKALDYYMQALEKRPRTGGEACGKLGELYWKLEDLAKAEEELLRGLRRQPDNIWALNTLTNFAADLYKKRNEPDKALKIYQAIYDIKGGSYENEYHNRVGLVHYYQENYEAAAAAFRAAIAVRPDYQLYHSNLSDALKNLRQWQAAIEEMERASALEVEAGGKPRLRDLALIHNAEGNASYGAGDYAKAAACYESAITIDPEYPVLHSNRAYACEARRDGLRSANLDTAIAALERAMALNPDEESYRSRLDDLRADRRWRDRGARDFFSSGTDPFTPQIILEWPSDLIGHAVDEASGDLSSEMRGLCDEMEENIWKNYGVILPDICVRPFAKSSAPGRYVIGLNGVPSVAGTMPADRRLFSGAPDDLDRLEVRGIETTNPINGSVAYWISRDDWAKVEDAGLLLWKTLDYPLRHLETVIGRNLPDVVGHQEIARTLEVRLPEAVEEVRADGGFLTDLVMVLRGFLAEQLTIAPLAKLLPEFRRLRETGIPLVEIVEKLRLLEPIRSLLPANAAYHSYISVSPEYEKMIAESIEDGGGQPVLAMEPLLCQQALTAVRNSVSHITSWAAVVVENAAIRPHLRKLIELEFPYLWVLSRAELLPAQAEKFIGEIEWEAVETDD